MNTMENICHWQSDDEEVDFESISAMLEGSDDEIQDKIDSNHEDLSQQDIDEFLGADDSDSEHSGDDINKNDSCNSGLNLSAEQVVHSLEENSCEPMSENILVNDVVKVVDVAPDAVAPATCLDTSVEDFLEEYKRMEEMMAVMKAKRLELTKRGLFSQLTKQGDSFTKIAESDVACKADQCPAPASSKSSSTETRGSDNVTKSVLMDLNVDLFSGQLNDSEPGAHSKCSSATITRPGKRKRKAEPVANVSEIAPVKFYKQTNSMAAAIVYADDDDGSDWEGLDGEKTYLSKEGEEIKRLMKKSGTKNRIAHAPKHSISSTTDTHSVPSNIPGPHMNGLANQSQENSWEDPFSGMKIIKPLVSESTMASRMEGRRLVRMSRIGNHSRKTLVDTDWVTIGAIVGKSDTRNSSKGQQYLIWTLSDLEDCDNSVKFFLFGDVYKNLWKESVGTVVGILNPSFMANEDKANTGVSLTIDNHQKVMRLGQSRDYGVCKATTKSGKSCFNVINRSHGDYCTYHVQTAYKKACAKRSELQAGYSGPKPRSFENKIFKNKGDTVFYGGQSFTCEGATSKRKTVTANSIKSSASNGKLNAFTLNKLQPEDAKLLTDLAVAKADKLQAQAGLHEMLAMPTRGSMNLLRHLSKEVQKEKEKQEGQKIIQVKPSEFMKQQRKEFALKRKQRKEGGVEKIPQLGRGFQPGQEICFEQESRIQKPWGVESSVRTLSKAEAAARLKAPLERNDPNAVKKKVSSQMQDRVRKHLAEASIPTPVESESELPASKRPKILGGLDIESEEVQKMLRAGSSHKGAVAEIEQDQQEKYFVGLEKQETLEQKMLGIKKIKVTVVTCKVCKYTTDQKATDSCRRSHPQALVTFKAEKQFFKCTSCSQRTTAFDKYPNHSCTKCGSDGFEKTSMWQERKCKQLENEKLLLRGEERKYVGC